MMRLLFALLTASCTLFAASAWAADPSTMAVVERLAREGYGNVTVTQTLFRRTLITAQSETHLREVVLHRTTGEVLRDRLFPLPTPSPEPGGSTPSASDRPTVPGAAANDPSGAAPGSNRPRAGNAGRDRDGRAGGRGEDSGSGRNR